MIVGLGGQGHGLVTESANAAASNGHATGRHGGGMIVGFGQGQGLIAELANAVASYGHATGKHVGGGVGVGHGHGGSNLSGS